MNISIIGGGYVGTVTGTCLADLGNQVTIIDIDSSKTDRINKGISPIYEPGLAEILANNNDNIRATTDFFSGVYNSDISFICVGTPSDKTGSIDLKFIEHAAAQLGSTIKQKNKYHLIIVKSTVIPGTCDNVITPLIEKYSEKNKGEGFGICSNPEFLREGNAVYDFYNPDRIIIGSDDTRCNKILREIYSSFHCPVIECPIKTAEMIKYVSNSFLALKISYANEIGNLCKTLDIDSYDVFSGVGADKRIGSLFFNSGLGFGGSCFPKDVKALKNLAELQGIDPAILNAALNINEEQPKKMISILQKHIPLKNAKIGLLGLAFKPNTDDIRDARSIDITDMLLKEGAVIYAYDPLAIDNFKKIYPGILYTQSAEALVQQSDVVLIITEWSEFEQLDFKQKIVIDGRHLLNAKKTAGIYEGVCW